MPSLVPSKAREEKIFHVVKWQRMAEKGKFFEITMIGGVTLEFIQGSFFPGGKFLETEW